MGRVSRLVTGVLVIIFCMSALVKITPRFDPKTHGFMKNEFKKFARVSPQTQLFKIKVDPVQFMRTFAFIEGFIGLFLLTGPKEVSILASLVGIILQGSVIQMMFMLGNPRSKMAAASVIITFLVVNIAILLRSKDEQQRIKTE